MVFNILIDFTIFLRFLKEFDWLIGNLNKPQSKITMLY